MIQDHLFTEVCIQVLHAYKLCVLKQILNLPSKGKAVSLWKRQKSLKTAELEFFTVSASKKPSPTTFSIRISVTDSVLNVPTFFHKIERNRESKNMNEIIYCKTDLAPAKTKKSLVNTWTYSKKSALLLTCQLVWGYICA